VLSGYAVALGRLESRRKFIEENAKYVKNLNATRAQRRLIPQKTHFGICRVPPAPPIS